MYSWKSGDGRRCVFALAVVVSLIHHFFLRCRLVGIGSSQNHATQGFAPPAHRNESSLSRASVLEIAVEAPRLHSSAATSLWRTVFLLLRGSGHGGKRRWWWWWWDLKPKTITDCVFFILAEFIINTAGLIINPSLISSIVYELLSREEAERWE